MCGNVLCRTRSFFLIATIVVVTDQLTKFLVKNTIHLNDSWPKQGFFRITHCHNTGAAFSIFPDSRIVLSIVSSIGIMVVLCITLMLSRRFIFLRWKSSVVALGLMLGGTVGNWIDRVFVGHVTDFISVWKWPDFNIADSALVVGCILLSINLIRASKTEHAHESTGVADGR